MNGTFTTGKAVIPDLDEMLKAVEKIRGLPAQKWMLIAPDGRIWADVDPIHLLNPIFIGNAKITEKAQGMQRFNPLTRSAE